LTKEKYRTMVILRSDGTSLYSTKDLALAKQKFEQYHVDRSIYVVDFRQSLHCSLKILELWGLQAPALSPVLWICHAAGGHVGAAGAVLFKDVADEAVKRARGESEKRKHSCSRTRDRTQIGLGVTYSILSVDNNKDIVFNITKPYPSTAAPDRTSKCVRERIDPQEQGEDQKPATFDYELTKHEIELIEQTRASTCSRLPTNTVRW
jgi:arginyl-tRNA synthetase